jgi:hypothetical protein
VPVSSVSDAGFSAVTNAPSVDLGQVSVTISTTEFGDVVVANALTFVGPLPVVDSLQPPTGNAAGGDSVVLSGTGFFNNSVVTFGGQAAMVTQASFNQLTVTTPPGMPGQVDVVVQNGDGQQSAPVSFTYVAPPVVAGVCPPHVEIGGQFEVSGSNFDADATLAVATEAVTAMQPQPGLLVGTVPADFVSPADVTVTNPSTGLSSTLTGGLHGSELAGINVDSFARHGNHIDYTISGQGFDNTVQVHFDDSFGTISTPTTISATQLVGQIAVINASNAQVCYSPQTCSTFTQPAICADPVPVP